MYFAGKIIINQKGILKNIFLICWFMPVYMQLISIMLVGKTINGFFITESFISLLSYIFKFILFIIVICTLRGRIKRNLFVFLVAYCLFSYVNYISVAYKSYVLVEAMTSLIIFIVPIYILSEITQADMENFIFSWYRWAIVHTFVVVCIVIIGTISQKITYGDIAMVTVPQNIILLLGIFVYKWNVLSGMICFFINFVLLLIGGSRMPVIACFITFIYIYFFLEKRKFVVKFLLQIFAGVSLILLIVNIKPIFIFLNDYVTSFGINSRTISRFANEIGKLGILEMAESSGRKYIWSIAIDFIVAKKGMPGGFAVIRNLSGNHYNFPHNLFLDMGVMLGAFAIPVFILVIRRIIAVHRSFKYKNFALCSTFGIYFFIISMTGAYFLSDAYAIVFWGSLFFLRGSSEED